MKIPSFVVELRGFLANFFFAAIEQEYGTP